MRRISVVLPVYNETESIAPCLRGLASALANEEHEILVCCDTDEDTTLPAIAAMPDRTASVRLVKNTLGRGALNAIRSGFLAAQGDVVVTSMADLSDPPELIPRMAEKIRAGADVVSGSRYMRGDSQRGGPWLKRTLSRIAGVSLRWITGIGTHDSTSNFRAYSKSFLDSVSIESKAGFEIALELTVKAHLAGRRVDEVPSSWVERESGKSNFKLWKWLPSYLRWYLRAAIAPIVVWTATGSAFVAMVSRPPWSESPAILHRHVAGLLGAGAVAGLLLSRRRRGRTKLVDLVQTVLWLHPLHGACFRAGNGGLDLALTSAASASAVFLLARPRTRLARPIKFRVETALLVVVALAVWLVHIRFPTEIPDRQLDPSWKAALGCAALGDLRAGVDYVFTYGPLGALQSPAYAPELHTLKLLGWIVAVELCVASLLVRAGAFVEGRVWRVLFFVFLLLPVDQDSFRYLAVLGITVWLVEREGTSIGADLLAFGVLSALAQAKFVFLPVALLSVFVIAAERAARTGVEAAASTCAAFAAAFASCWWLAGQRFADVPAWIRNSLLVAEGYAGGCSTPAPDGSRILAAIVFAAFLVQSGLIVAGPLAPRRRILGAIAIPFLWIVFKGGFTRAADHTQNFFGFSVAASLLLPSPGPGALRALVATACRAACVAASFVGLVLAYPAKQSPLAWLGSVPSRIRSQAAALFRTEELRRSLDERLAGARRQNELPRIRQRVGDRRTDAFSSELGLLFLNELAWRPRPVFQSYLAYSPELMRLNAGFLESDHAPEFLLFRPDNIGEYFPTQADALALEIVARDYVPDLVEKGQLLLRREPRAERTKPIVEVERELEFGETLALSGTGAGCRLLEIDAPETTLGRARRILENTTPLRMEIDLDSGLTVSSKLSPAMARAGFIVDPCLLSVSDWMTWYTGGSPPRPLRLRIEPPREPWRFGDRMRVRVLRADGTVPRARPDLASQAMFSLFRSEPSGYESADPPAMRVLRRTEVVLLRAPSELRFEVAAGEHRLSARYGILASDWEANCPGGSDFRAILDAPGESGVVLFEKHVDPGRVELDRRLKYLDVRFTARAPSTLRLRAEPGSAGEKPCTDTVWTDISIE